MESLVSIGLLGDVDFSTWQNNGKNPLLALKPLFEKTDVVVDNVETVILHSVPFPWRVDLLKAIADGLKPSAVVCGHSHVYQGWFWQDRIPICLSYGNGFMNLAYHEKANSKSRIGCYSVLNFDANGCLSVDEHYFRIKPARVVELSEPEQVALRNDLNCVHRMLDDERALGDAWERACHQAWKPRRCVRFFR